MNAPQPPEPSNLVDELSAYLDGELDSESSQRIEGLLATDAHPRSELQRLERAWEALNRLSSVEVGPSFTQTTVAMIAVTDAPEQATSGAARAQRHLRGWLAAAVVLLAAGAAGFGIMAATDPHTNQRLLLDLPVIENIDLYQKAGSIGFLQSLHASGLFADKKLTGKDKHPADRTEPKVPATQETTLPDPTVADSLAERRAKVEQLNHDQKSDLLLNLERFEAMSPDEQRQLRIFQSVLENDPQAAELRRTLSRYSEWLSTVSVGDRIELQKLTEDQRVARISELRQLPARDLTEIQKWVEERALANLPIDKRQYLEKQPEAERRRLLFREYLMRWQANEQGRWQSQFNDQDIKDLASRLTPASQQRLLSASMPKVLLAQWVRQALFPFGAYGNNKEGDAHRSNVGPERLMRYYQTLDESEKNKLLSMPANEFQNRLRGQYDRTQGQQPGQPRLDNSNGPPIKPRRPDGRGPGMGEDRRPFFPSGERPPMGDRPFGDRPAGGPRPPNGDQPSPPRGGDQP